MLSKGHTCPALYSILAAKSFFAWEELTRLRHVGALFCRGTRI